MSKLLGRDDFLSDRKFKRELVDVPELGGQVYLRELSTRQLLEYNGRIETLKEKNPKLTAETSVELMCMLIAMSACDEAGVLLFTEADVVGLSESRLEMIARLSTQVLNISGVSSEVSSNLGKALESSSPTN
jgi:hypothetical protein